MYSSGEPSGEGLNSRNQFNNWQLATQSACNMSANNVDWAVLAQQWIQMRETSEISDFTGMPEPPPPPIITKDLVKTAKYDEQGEADMEVEKDDENEIHLSQFATLAYQLQNQQSSKTNPQSWFTEEKHQMQNLQHPQPWNNWQARIGIPPPTVQLPTMESSAFKSNSRNIPMLKTPLMSNELNKVDIPPMDASKRKILPAWIREGLEKMEREKAKLQDYPTSDENSDLIVSTRTTDINNMVNSRLIETDSDKSGCDDIAETIKTEGAFITNKSRTPEAVTEFRIDSGKTHEEMIEELMFVVRRSLTALLLEVTNEEILSISQEELKKHKSKASAAQVFRKSALTSIAGNLGLGAYADSSSDNSESENENDANINGAKFDRDDESEEEIKANIRSRKRAFALIEEEIEELVADDEAKKELRRRTLEKVKEREISYSKLISRRSPSPINKKGFSKDFGEAQQDKKNYSNGKNRKRERTSRFSDNKDSKFKSESSYFVAPSLMRPTVSNVPVGASSTLLAHNSKTSVLRDYDKIDKTKSSSSLSRRHSSNSSDSSSNSRESYDRYSNSSKSKYLKRSSSSSSRKQLSLSKKTNSSRNRYHSSSDSSDDHYYNRKSLRYRSRSYSRRERDKNRSETRSRSRSKSKTQTNSSRKRSKRT